MSQNRPPSPRMPVEGQPLGKLEPPVERSAPAGDNALALTSAIQNPPAMQNPSITLNEEKTPGKDPECTMNPRKNSIIPDPPKISTTPNVSQNPLNLGYLDVQARPDTQEPPSVIGTINGNPARILLDSGCSTYVLSEEFAVHAGIHQYPTTPVAVELAVRDAGQPTLETQTKELSMSIGQFETRKALYIAPLPRYDAILGAPFVQEFDVRFPQNPVAVIKGIEVPLIQETPRTQKIQMISRAKLKKLVRRDQADEMYIANVRIVDPRNPETPENPRNPDERIVDDDRTIRDPEGPMSPALNPENPRNPQNPETPEKPRNEKSGEIKTTNP